MKIVALFTLTCLACVLNTQGFGIGSPENEKILVKRSPDLGLAAPFLEVGCSLGPFKCNDYLLNIFKGKDGKDKESADKDKDAAPAAEAPAAGDEAAPEAPAE